MTRIVSRGLAAAVLAVGVLCATSSAQDAASSLPTITIALSKGSIVVGGALQSGAVNIRSVTTGERSASPVLLRLNPGVTADQVKAFAGTKAARDSNNVARYGTTVFDAEAPKGTTNVQTTLEPGNYVAVDTNGEDPAKFPFTSFTIVEAGQPAVLPAPKATVRAIEFGFRGPRTLHVGDLVRFENRGFLSHMIVGVRVDNLAGARKVIAALRAGDDKKVRSLARGFAGFLDPVSPGVAQQFTLKAKPGVYVLACFEDTQDHREHTRLGMVRVIHIAR